MHHRVSRSYWLFIGIIKISLLTTGAWAQDATPSTNALTVPSTGNDAKTYVDFGKANGARGDLDGAIAAFNEAIKIDPKYALAYYYRGLAHKLQNKFDDAVADYTQTIQINPEYAEAYYERGSLRGQQGDFDDAISDFSQVIKLDPKYSPAYYNLGHVQYFKGNLDAALDGISEALRLAPNFPISYYIRGLVRHAQGHQLEATSDFQKSLGLGFPDAAFWVWITEMESGERGLARKDLSDALGKPDLFKQDDWPSQIGGFLLDKITEDQLIAKTKTANQDESARHLCEAWFYSGMARHFTGDSKGAQDCFAKAIATGAKGSEELIEASREAAALKTQ